MNSKLSVLLGIVGLLAAAPLLSHHSFTAEFDVGRPISITGTVSEIEWTNPHAWIFVDVEDDDGNVESWAVELLGINALMRSGLTPRTLKAGDRISVEGYGSRDGTNTGNASVVINANTDEVLWSSAAGGRR